MSFILMAKALKVDFPDAHTKLLMLALADHANEETGECFPSLTRLAKRACMSKSTVAVKLNWLEENKWITRDRGTFNKSTRYYLNLNKENVVREEDKVVRQTDKVVRQTDTNLPITYKETINSNNDYSKDFENLWKNYPRKENKALAYKKYLAMCKKHTKTKVFEFTKTWIIDFKNKNKDTTYCKHMATFLNQETFLDSEFINLNKPKLNKNQIAG